MVSIEPLLLLGGILVLLGIFSSKISSRVSVPVLVLFLILGMLAGSEGIGRIAFENYALAHAVGTLALALILFDGGLRTPMAAVRSAWKPAVTLATVGVVITAVVTGVAAAWILGVPLVYGLLLGSIVSSTDAAAVFSILRGQGVGLDERLAATLEVESGSNDPMAIFLTIGFVQYILGDLGPGAAVLGFFAAQMLVGAGVGLLFGWVGIRVVNRINLDAAGLYPILVGTLGILSFATAAVLGGSGFLAVYLTGIVLGNADIVFRRGIFCRPGAPIEALRIDPRGRRVASAYAAASRRLGVALDTGGPQLPSFAGSDWTTIRRGDEHSDTDQPCPRLFLHRLRAARITVWSRGAGGGHFLRNRRLGEPRNRCMGIQ